MLYQILSVPGVYIILLETQVLLIKTVVGQGIVVPTRAAPKRMPCEYILNTVDSLAVVGLIE